MNEKSSPSNTAPLKSSAHSEDAPHGEWFLISNAKGGLYGYRWPDGDDEMYITRRVIECKDDHAFNGVPSFEDWLLPGIAKFLSGAYGFDTPSRIGFEDGHPCYGSLEGFPLGEWYTIAFTGGCVACYRFPEGVFLADGAWYPTGEDNGPPPAPLFYPEEYQDVIQFFVGSGGLESLDEGEGGLVR